MKNYDSLTERIFLALRKEHIVIGKTRIRSSHAWLIFGFATFIAMSAVFVAIGNSGFGQAAIITSSLTVTTTSRPNIVVIMSDDQDYQMMYNVKRKDGSPLMPAVQSLLAVKGVTFSNNYVAHSLCCPSRSTFLTGQYDHNHGVWANGLSDNAEEAGVTNGGYTALDHTNTLPVWLQKAGYITAHIGKYLNGYGTQVPPETIPPGWSDWNGLMDPTTYFYYGYKFNENGKMRRYGVSTEDYQTDVISNKAVTFIQNHARNVNPFFLSIAGIAPHSGAPAWVGPVPAPRHIGYFSDLRAPRLPNFNEADITDKPQGFQNTPLFKNPMSSSLIKTVDLSYKLRAETLMAVDDLVRSVVDALILAGKLDNTIIIYTSDNGYEHGEHRLPQQKDFIYEESLRVPLIILGPGVPKGQINSSFVSNVDLAPTIVEFAKAIPQRVMDGKSLIPLIQGTVSSWRTALYIEGDLPIYSNSNPPPAPIVGIYRGVRTKDYKYVEYNDTGEKEFYNFTVDACHKADPYELESQHANSCEQATMSSLKQILKQFTTCSGQTCWYASGLPPLTSQPPLPAPTPPPPSPTSAPTLVPIPTPVPTITSAPVASTCGNGILESKEQCDGTNLNGQTCTSQGFNGGTLLCASSCTFDTVRCTSSYIQKFFNWIKINFDS